MATVMDMGGPGHANSKKKRDTKINTINFYSTNNNTSHINNYNNISQPPITSPTLPNTWLPTPPLSLLLLWPAERTPN
jgi:hypothetical protein